MLTNILDEIFSLADPRIREKKDQAIKQNAKDRYYAKKLATELNIELTIERDGIGDWACWIEYHKEQVGAKGWADNLYCHTWGDVREKLELIKAA